MKDAKIYHFFFNAIWHKDRGAKIFDDSFLSLFAIYDGIS